MTGSSAITPFTIDIPQSALDDLKRRLDLTRYWLGRRANRQGVGRPDAAARLPALGSARW
jgi:hypothetical protein